MQAYTNEGKIIQVKGLPNHVSNKGMLCIKGRSAVEYQYDPNRLKTPLKRIGQRGQNRWQEISWNEALTEISAKLLEFKENWGAKSIVWHKGSGSGWGSNWSYVRRFMNAFGSPNIASLDHLCYTPRTIGHKYTYGEHLLPDYENAKLIILWGFNPYETSLTNHGRRINDAKKRGAKLVVVDPRKTLTAQKSDLFIQLRPGSDCALALGVLNYIIEHGLYDKGFVDKWVNGFEEFRQSVADYTVEKTSELTWVPKEEIEALSNLYVTNSPGAVLEDGNGIEQQTNVVQTTRAISILQAITGNVDVPGGNVFPLSLNLRNLTLKEKITELSKKETESVSTHPLFYPLWGVSTPEVFDTIDSGKPYPLKALIVQGSSLISAVSGCQKAKEKLNKFEYIIVHDLFMTSTAEYADIVLPAATFLEYTHVRRELSGNPGVNTLTLTLANKVVEPLGECWSDAKFIFEIAKRTGLEEYFPWSSEREAIDYELEPLGLTVDELEMHPEGLTFCFSADKVYHKYEKKGFPTATGKIDVYSKTFENYGYDPLPRFEEPKEGPYSTKALLQEYPLICGTGIKLGAFTNTQFRKLPSISKMHRDPFVEINPETAHKLSIQEADWVIVESPRGKIRVRAKFTSSVHPKVVLVAHGWENEKSVNILTDDKVRCPISGATSNRAFLCKVYKEQE
jgi:formate dehydrogenase (coenzyme F420) alpha subunit